MARILVTGGKGFVGAHCLIQLLAAGHETRTTVRDLARENDVRAMLRKGGAGDAGNRLTFFAADLNADAGWAEASAGCDYVLHVASPFPSTVPKDENELIVPARDGALRVLRAARDASVKRVVLTSSFAAIGYGSKGRTAAFTEEDWTNLNDTSVQPYQKSKTIAEREAWDFIAREGGGLELAVVNPVGIFGPVLGPDYSTSILIVKRLMEGSIPGCPDLWFGVVDVRDVADLHLKAMTVPAARGERFLATAGDFTSFRQIAQILKEGAGEAAPQGSDSLLAQLAPACDRAFRSTSQRGVAGTWQAQECVQRKGASAAGLVTEEPERCSACNRAEFVKAWTAEAIGENMSKKVLTDRKAYIITGPTSGIGRATAFQVVEHGTVVLVGRDAEKLRELQRALAQTGGHAVSVVCDLSDIVSVRRATAEIIALKLPVAGLLNNAGIMQMRPTKNELGWDMSFATNHLGPFALTEALVPSLPNGANVVFVVSAVEDPERKPAVAAGFRGGRYISAKSSARGEWEPGGAKRPGFDAYATSKQAILAAAMAFARETPRLHFNAVEPGVNPTTGLGGGDAGAFVRFLQRFIIPLLVPLLRPFIKILSTPKQAARVITKILIDTSGHTGIYYGESGHPMQGSALVRDPKFQNRVVTETRAFLAAHSE